MSIGERAARAIKTRVASNGTSLKVELAELSVSYAMFNHWEHGRFSPSAFFLRRMALAGYDVVWILTGGSKRGK